MFCFNLVQVYALTSLCSLFTDAKYVMNKEISCMQGLVSTALASSSLREMLGHRAVSAPTIPGLKSTDWDSLSSDGSEVAFVATGSPMGQSSATKRSVMMSLCLQEPVLPAHLTLLLSPSCRRRKGRASYRSQRLILQQS